MSDVLTLFAFLELLGAAQGAKQGPPGQPGPPGPPAQGAPPVGPTPAPAAAPVAPAPVAPAPVAPAPVHMPPPGDVGPPPSPVPAAPVAPPVAPAVLPPMPPWPTPPTPGTLPPFPGPGWCPDTPVTATVANRAAYWNPQLWDYPTKTQRRAFVQEQFGGSWVTFAAAWHPGTAGPKTYMATEAFRLCTAPPIAPPTPVTPATPPVAPPMAKPGPVGPEPAAGAWQSNAAFITRYQSALTWLSQQGNNPALDPKGIDGKFGPNTSLAVKAFQSTHGLSPIDGECGNVTAAALDTAMGYTAVMPASPSPAPAPAPAHPAAAPAASAPFVGPPPQVLPYPGTGAWQSNTAYVQRYQAALTWLSQALNSPAYDPHGIDGKFGPNTSNAVKAFQQAHGISPVDGEAGPATAAAIDAAVVATGGASS